MNRNFRGIGWRRLLLVASVSGSVALGAVLALGQAIAPAPGTPGSSAAPAGAVSAEDHAAAVEAFKKARDLWTAERYAEAKVENDRALKLDPGLSDAQILRGILQTDLTTTTMKAGETATTGAAGADKVRLIKTSDISLIRFKELSTEDLKQMRGTIDAKTLNTFWDQVVMTSGANVSKDAKSAFVSPTNFTQQVQMIRDSGDVGFMEKVNFTSDPAALVNFKKTIQPFVLQNCATAQCHASEKGGSFRLIKPANTDQVAYTNFYILSMYSGRDGKMIDRDQPEKSLLLQYSLPKTVTATPHPKVDISHHFADATSPEFQNIVLWIKGLSFPRPNYGISYEIPGPAPVAPATMPAATKAAATRPAK